MRLIFKNKNNSNSSTPASPGSPASPTLPKKSRLGSILSPFKNDSSTASPSPSAVTDDDRRPTTASPPLNPLPSPEQTPPASRPLDSVISSDLPLPTSEVDNTRFTASSHDTSNIFNRPPRNNGRLSQISDRNERAFRANHRPASVSVVRPVDTASSRRPSSRLSEPPEASSPLDRYGTSSWRTRAFLKPQHVYLEEDQVSYGDSPLSHRSGTYQKPHVNGARTQVRGTSIGSARAELSLPRIRDRERSASNPQRSEPLRVSSQHLITQRQNVNLDGAKDKSRRPEYLNSHQSSQRSSAHSFQSRDSDATIGASRDSKTAEPTSLPRLPSFSSIASSVSEIDVRGQKRSRSSTLQPNLTKVLEANASNTTPKAKILPPQDPSETVVAQHVQKVQVPETVVKQFKARVEKTPFRADRNIMSLKEQNEKVDKLTKENFDLKLKIHFLYQALEDRSEEGVKDLITKNAQLQSDLVQVKKENASLRKQVNAFERQSTREGASSIGPSQLDEDGISSHNALLEEEIATFNERLRELEAENAALTRNGAQHLAQKLKDEVVLREQAEQKVRALQRELDRSGHGSKLARLKIRGDEDRSRKDYDLESLSGSTLVETLRKENESLKRDLGAQASMLTSRNRERDRLQQEIEDLKLVQRRGEGLSVGSAAGDSIFDRSVSRAQHRPTSRASKDTGASELSENERDRFETALALLRDENSLMKMQLQDMGQELDSLGHGAEHIRNLQDEREQALQALKEADSDMEFLADEIRHLEDILTKRDDDITTLQAALKRREADLRTIENQFDAIVYDSETHQATIQSLQQDMVAANGDMEAMEVNLREVASAKERLEVQQESYQNEIAFLREEQETDKIKLSELQSTIDANRAGQASSVAVERTLAAAREEARQTQKKLSQREADVKILEARLGEATSTLEDAANSFDATKASYNEELDKLEKEIERLNSELGQHADKQFDHENMLKRRDTLLESSGAEVRRLGEMLEKERQARKHDRNEFDRTLQRAKGMPEGKIIELDRALKAASARIGELEGTGASQRDALIYGLWNRLAALSTAENIERHQPLQSVEDVEKELPQLVERLPSALDSVAAYLDHLRDKVAAADNAISLEIEGMASSLADRTARLEGLEQSLASAQQASHQAAGAVEKAKSLKEENRLLRRELKYLKQGSFALPGLSTQDDIDPDSSKPLTADSNAMPSPMIPKGPSSKEKARNRLSMGNGPTMLLRAYSVNDGDALAQNDMRSLSTTNLPNGIHDSDDETASNGRPDSRRPQRSASSMAALPMNTNEKTWVMRLDDMVRRLRHEREERILDRRNARERLTQSEQEREELKRMLRREKERTQLKLSAAGVIMPPMQPPLIGADLQEISPNAVPRAASVV